MKTRRDKIQAILDKIPVEGEEMAIAWANLPRCLDKWFWNPNYPFETMFIGESAPASYFFKEIIWTNTRPIQEFVPFVDEALMRNLSTGQNYLIPWDQMLALHKFDVDDLLDIPTQYDECLICRSTAHHDILCFECSQKLRLYYA